MSTSSSTARADPRTRHSNLFSGPSSSNTAKPAEVVASTSYSNDYGYSGSQTVNVMGAGYLNRAKSNYSNLSFFRKEGKEKREQEVTAQIRAAKSSARTSSSQTGWAKAPISIESVTRSSQGSQGTATTSKAVKKKVKKEVPTIDLDPSDDEANDDGDTFSLTTSSTCKSISKVTDTNWVFSSQESARSSTSNPPLGVKRKASATTSQTANDTTKAKKSKKSFEYEDFDSPVSTDTKIGKPGTGSIDTRAAKSSGSKKRELAFTSSAPKSKASAPAANVTDLTTSSPASASTSNPLKRKAAPAYDNFDSDDQELTDPEQGESRSTAPRPKLRPTGKSKPAAKTLSPVHGKQDSLRTKKPQASSTRPPLGNAENRREHQTKQADPDATPKAALRPTPSVLVDKGKRSSLLHKSARNANSEHSSDSDAPFVASSPRTAKKVSRPALSESASALVQRSSLSDLEATVEKDRARPRAKPSVSRQASSSMSKPLASLSNKASVIDISESPIQKPEKKARRRQQEQEKQRSSSPEKEQEKERSSSPEEHFGDATQAMWFHNALNGKDVDTGELLPGSESSQNSTQTEIELALSDEEDAFGDKITQGPICPFCDGALPSKPSALLIEMLNKLCHRLDVSLREGSHNPYALNLPASVTAATCKRHRDEREVIPKGLAKKYPAAGKINFEALGGRFLRGCMKPLVDIVQGRLESTFLDDAKKEWDERGARKMGNVINEWGSFEQELPGYYGQQGFEAIMAILNEHLAEACIILPHRTAPLDVQSYLRRVMLPETAIRLIQEDQACSRKKGLRVLRESRPYGAAVFARTIVEEAETAVELREREKEEQETVATRKAILASGGKQAEAVKRAEKAILELQTMLSD